MALETEEMRKCGRKAKKRKKRKKKLRSLRREGRKRERKKLVKYILDVYSGPIGQNVGFQRQLGTPPPWRTQPPTRIGDGR